MPLFGGMDFWDTVAPNSSFIFPQGQAISRATYAAAFARWGTIYGSGDGSTTFNVPDKTGRVSAMLEATSGGSRLTAAGAGVVGSTMGSAGGSQNKTLQRSDLPNVNAQIAITDPGHTHTPGLVEIGQYGSGSSTAAQVGTNNGQITNSSSTTGITGTVNLNGNVSQTLVNGLPPLIVCNYIIRIT